MFVCQSVNAKSSGIDDIHAEHIKYAPPCIHENITTKYHVKSWKPIGRTSNWHSNTTAETGNKEGESINQSINALYSGKFHPHTNYVITQLCDKKNKQTSMHVHIAYASNAGAMGKCIYDHCQQCSVGLNCMTAL